MIDILSSRPDETMSHQRRPVHNGTPSECHRGRVHCIMVLDTFSAQGDRVDSLFISWPSFSAQADSHHRQPQVDPKNRNRVRETEIEKVVVEEATHQNARH